MRALILIATLLLSAGALCAQDVPGPAVDVKGPDLVKPSGDEPAKPAEKVEVKMLDLKDVAAMVVDFQKALYRTDQDKFAEQVAAQVKPRVDAILADVKSPKPSAEAVRMIGFAKSEAATPALIELLKSNDDTLRSAAAFALGVSGDKKAVDELVKLLDDKNVPVMTQAAIALGRIRDNRCFDALASRLDADDPLRRLAVIKALGLLGDRNAAGKLEEHLLKCTDPLEQTAVYDALNLIAGDDLFRIVEQLNSLADVLQKHGTGEQTQLAQAAVTEALDRFIKEQEKKQQQGGGKGGGKKRQTSTSQQPGQQSGKSSAKSQGGTSPRQQSDVDDVAAKDARTSGVEATAGAVWGNLPPAVQEEVTAALKQELPERYRNLLKIYYKILAEGK